jgi:hypothetical protein
MKRYYLLLPALVMLGRLFAQAPYFPVLVEGRSWQFFWSHANGFCGPEYGYQAFLQGDTTLLGHTYHKVVGYPMGSYVQDAMGPFCEPFYVDTTYIVPLTYYLVREDTAARRLYYYTTLDGPHDELLFDFNLGVGDTLTDYPNGEPLIITSIDTIVLENGALRRRFNIASWADGVAYIEGIGSVQDPFGPLYIPFESTHFVTCVSDGDELLYKSPSSEDCAAPFVSTAAPTVAAGMSVGPNPATDLLTVENLRSDGKPVEFALYTAEGRLIIRSTVGTTQWFSLAGQSGGLYYWTVDRRPGGKLLKF